jgi:hypothetical protein
MGFDARKQPFQWDLDLCEDEVFMKKSASDMTE